MRENQHKQFYNPFSGECHNDFIYDFYLEDRISKLYSKKLVFTPQGKEIEVLQSIELTKSCKTVRIVKNIPDYLELINECPSEDFKSRIIPQYNGYAIDFSKYKTVDEYLNKQFSSRNRRKLKSKMRKLNSTGKLSIRFYYNDVIWEDHVKNFDGFFQILKGRFDQMKMYNRNLIHWPFFCKNSFDRIKKRKAFLLVIELNGSPIGYSLDYIKDGLVFGVFQSYNIEYSNYNLGDILMFQKLNWCFENQIDLYDFSIGANYFKKKWANYEYLFNNQIWYRNSIIGNIQATKITFLLKLRQQLRNWGILGNLFEYDKVFYKKQNKKLQDFDWVDHLSSTPK